MRTNWNSLSGLRLRLKVIGIPTYSINPFVELIDKWVHCSGEEWTISRLKHLKIFLIHQYTGSQYDYSLAKNRHGGIKGIVGSLMRYAQKSDDNFIKVINAFMAYTHWVSPILTKSQKKKFLEAISAPQHSVPVDLIRALERTTRNIVHQRQISTKPQSLLEWQGSPVKRSPTFNRGSVSQDSAISQELFLLDNEETWQHVRTLWDEIYSHVFKGYHVHKWVDSAHYDDIDTSNMVAGEVHFLQEPGYKLRSIASPYRMFQVASEPLKHLLKGIITDLEWDCTHCQDRAFPVVQRAIRQGKVVHSVDLSSATDLFPLELQLSVLQQIIGKESGYLKLFRDVSRADWKSDIGKVKWNKGQPLGFNPSFFLFTLTHGLLLRTLLGRRWNQEFFVVGDDVLIFDDILYQKYIDTLSTLGCSYSPSKSISSNKLAEFAGKLIIHDKVIPQLKWRSISDDNFLDLAKLIGRNIKLLLSRKQKKVLEVFEPIPDFIHPLGLNWSYPGSNLEEMIRKGLELTFDEKVLNSLTGLRRKIHGHLYSDYGPYSNDLRVHTDEQYILEAVKTFDEKVKSVFLKLGFREFNFDGFLDGLKDIPRGLFNEELPLEVREPSRVSTLRRLSDKLFK